MKVFDCFPFFNELEILELRLMELNDAVDYFVIVEANKSHNGTPKEFVFEKNKDKFKDYLDKIIYVKVEDMPPYRESTERHPNRVFDLEYFQRNQIMRGLHGKAEIGDKIMVSDCDEIPSADAVRANLNREGPDRESWATFKQTMFYYYVNTMVLGSWCGTVIANYGTFGTRPQSLRWFAIKRRYVRRSPEVIRDGGWHYSYMTCGDAEKVKEKVNMFAEKVLIPVAGSTEDIARKMATQRDLYERDGKGRFKMQLVDISNSKPKNLDKWLEKYPGAFYK
jgi:beta-1,4-mannosyl-glycoprotein beta-1,4-N-acetylglucosaminyltransferase